MQILRCPQQAAMEGGAHDWTYLADTGVADEEKLEEVVVLASVHGARRGLEVGAGSWGGLAGGRGGRR